MAVTIKIIIKAWKLPITFILFKISFFKDSQSYFLIKKISNQQLKKTKQNENQL